MARAKYAPAGERLRRLQEARALVHALNGKLDIAEDLLWVENAHAQVKERAS